MSTNSSDYVDKVVGLLRERGLTVHDRPTFDIGPTEFRVQSPLGNIAVAVDFNWPGWEAMLEQDGDGIPLRDGPPSDDTDDGRDVADWVERLALRPELFAA